MQGVKGQCGGRDGCTSTEEAVGLFIKIFYLKASVTKAKRVFLYESHRSHCSN